MEVDLETEHMPDGGHRISGLTDDHGVQRIARELSKVEQAFKAQMEGRPAEEEKQKETQPLRAGFQVVSADMFSHAFDPVLRFTPGSIAFNSTCIAKLNRVIDSGNGPSLERCRFVEILLNPIERMLAVRPCTPGHPNAVKWTNEKGASVYLSSRAFCRMLYGMLDWDPEYGYRVPAVLRSKDGESVLFFDLDNYIGREIGRRREVTDGEEAEPETQERTEEDTHGIFYAAEDDEPEEVVDTEEMERRLKELAEREKRTFGTPVFEHNGMIRLPAIDEDGEWDVMAETRVLGTDHRVAEHIVSDLQDRLFEAKITSEIPRPPVSPEPGTEGE